MGGWRVVTKVKWAGGRGHFERLESRMEGWGTQGNCRVVSKVKGGHVGRLESRMEGWGTVGG